jgi:hypothetical protein
MCCERAACYWGTREVRFVKGKHQLVSHGLTKVIQLPGDRFTCVAWMLFFWANSNLDVTSVMRFRAVCSRHQVSVSATKIQTLTLSFQACRAEMSKPSLSEKTWSLLLNSTDILIDVLCDETLYHHQTLISTYPLGPTLRSWPHITQL